MAGFPVGRQKETRKKYRSQRHGRSRCRIPGLFLFRDWYSVYIKTCAHTHTSARLKDNLSYGTGMPPRLVSRIASSLTL